MNFSQEQIMGWLVANQDIPTSEMEQDIAATEYEIATMRREAEGFALIGDKMSDFRRRARLDGIKDRETFIAKLKAILEVRALLSPEPQLRQSNSTKE